MVRDELEREGVERERKIQRERDGVRRQAVLPKWNTGPTQAGASFPVISLAVLNRTSARACSSSDIKEVNFTN